jgi:predicted RNA binding protein YcfA (HicA-like mRNA interferase family)
VAPIKAREVESALLKKGFELDQRHHRFFFLVVDGRSSGIFTRISHGHEDIGDKILGRMARQMKIKRRELDEFVSCSMSGNDYLARLRAGGVL